MFTLRPNLISKNLTSNFFKIIKNSVHTTKPTNKSFKDWYRSIYEPRTVDPPYQHITQIGDPILRTIADPVPENLITSKEINFLIQQMISVLRKYDCVGLSAPQVGIPLRVIVMEFKSKVQDVIPKEIYKSKEMATLPLTILVNPKLDVLNYEKQIFTESCGSVKGYAGDVARFKEVKLNFFDRSGISRELKLKGWNARIVQHEMDHLDGRIYTDIMDRKTLSCTCWQAVNAREGRINIPFNP